MTVNITVGGVEYPVPSSASDTNWAAQQVDFELAVAAQLDTNTSDIATLGAQLIFTAITPLNGWGNAGSPALAWAKATNGMVTVRGFIDTGASGTVCGTLPSGSRPAAATRMLAVLASDDACWVEVRTNGDIFIGNVITTHGGDVGDGLYLNFQFSTAA